MANTTIHLLGDTLVVGKAFLTGKDQLKLNGQLLFEGKLVSGKATRISASDREYSITSRPVSGLLGMSMFDVEVSEQGQVVHAQVYNHTGQPVRDLVEAKSSAVTSFCTLIGCIAGAVLLLNLTRNFPGLPGGALGGALKGAVGGAIGGGLGAVIGWWLARGRRADRPNAP